MKNGLSLKTRLAGYGRSCLKFLPMLAVAAMLTLPTIAFGQTGPTLPDLGIEPDEYVTAGGTKLGATLAVAFGIFIIVAIVMAAMYYFSRSAKAR